MWRSDHAMPGRTVHVTVCCQANTTGQYICLFDQGCSDAPTATQRFARVRDYPGSCHRLHRMVSALLACRRFKSGPAATLRASTPPNVSVSPRMPTALLVSRPPLLANPFSLVRTSILRD